MNIIVLCMYVYFGIFLSIFQNVTLQELMDEDDVVQECKSSNKKLVDLYVLPVFFIKGSSVYYKCLNPFATVDVYMRQLFHCLQWYAGSKRVKQKGPIGWGILHMSLELWR